VHPACLTSFKAPHILQRATLVASPTHGCCLLLAAAPRLLACWSSTTVDPECLTVTVRYCCVQFEAQHSYRLAHHPCATFYFFSASIPHAQCRLLLLLLLLLVSPTHTLTTPAHSWWCVSACVVMAGGQASWQALLLGFPRRTTSNMWALAGGRRVFGVHSYELVAATSTTSLRDCFSYCVCCAIYTGCASPGKSTVCMAVAC
jgi:hypothetical protein